MASTPVFIGTAKTWTLQVATANTNLDGATGTYGDLVAGGANGSIVEHITVKAAANTTAGMIRIFHDNGSNARLVADLPIAAATPSATVAAAGGLIVFPGGGHIVPNGHKLIASTYNAEAINLIAVGGDI
jgi:hypothetical protein